MNLFYAFGGGLGHLCRIHALIHTLKQNPEDFIILTNSEYAHLVFNQSRVIEVSSDYYLKPHALSIFIDTVIEKCKISNFFIDTFPCGIIGELSKLKASSCRFYYVGRLLNLLNFQSLISGFNLKFEHTYLVEDLHKSHLEFISKNSISFAPVILNYPKIGEQHSLPGIKKSFKSAPWLIAHSGPFNELEILFNHANEIANYQAQKPEFLVISQTRQKLEGENLLQVNYFPAVHLFSFAAKIFTACGFNSMYQTRQYVDIHHFIPFHRRFDDQFERARQRNWSKI